MRRILLLGAAALGLLGCGFPLELRTRFDRIGQYGSASKATPIVARVEDVQAYYNSAPDGFTLRENELKVEDDYAHKILGTVTAEFSKGDCHDGNGRKADVIRALQQVAFDHGGNAVIYVRSKLPDEQLKMDEDCPTADEPYGAGWVVILGGKTGKITDEETENPR